MKDDDNLDTYRDKNGQATHDGQIKAGQDEASRYSNGYSSPQQSWESRDDYNKRMNSYLDSKNS
jgi:hypothetical protein